MGEIPGAFGSHAELREILEMQSWAIVGCSPNNTRDSFRVAAFLQAKGKTIIPINPNVEGTILGEQVYADLADVPGQIDVVDVFRRSDAAGAFALQALDVRAKAVWFQLDVIDESAYETVKASGTLMVMNACPARDWHRVFSM